jgi:hypothetical protein
MQLAHEGDKAGPCAVLPDYFQDPFSCFLFFLILGFELRAYPLSVMGFFKIGFL